MATATNSTAFKPGDLVKWSGIYRVIHDQQHASAHEVTCVAHHKFPPCNHCGNHPRFELVRRAVHINVDDNFKA